MGKLGEEYGQYRDRIHESDTLYCLRSAYWNHVDPVKPDHETLFYYFTGGALGQLLEDLSGYERQKEYAIPVKHGFGEFLVVCTPDMYKGRPFEVKSSRAFKRKGRKLEDDIRPHYVRQLAHHCAGSGSSSGTLLVLYLNRAKDPFLCLDISFSENELAGYKQVLIFCARLLYDAIERGDPSGLPRAFAHWKCKKCVFKSRCKEAFNKDYWR